MGIEVEGRPLRRREDAPVVGWRRVSPSYLESLAIPLVNGRAINCGGQDGCRTRGGRERNGPPGFFGRGKMRSEGT
jgi:hypothetical protein